MSTQNCFHNPSIDLKVSQTMDWNIEHQREFLTNSYQNDSVIYGTKASSSNDFYNLIYNVIT